MILEGHSPHILKVMDINFALTVFRIKILLKENFICPGQLTKKWIHAETEAENVEIELITIKSLYSSGTKVKDDLNGTVGPCAYS